MDIIWFPKLDWQIKISEVAFRIGSIPIHWYGILISLGLLVAILYAMVRAKDFGIKTDPMIDVIIGGAIGAILGARIYYVLFSLSDYQGRWLDVFKIWEGGLAIYGGIIGGFLTAYFMCKWRKVNKWAMLDLASLGFLIGQTFGRWGNFFNQEAYGTNTFLPWGMTSEKIATEIAMNQAHYSEMGITMSPVLPVHPTFLYESLWCLLGFVVLHFLSKKRKFDGQVVLMYGIWYGTGRFFIEGLRTDSLLIGRSLRVSQLLSAIIVIACAALLILILRRLKENRGSERYAPLFAEADGAAAISAVDGDMLDRTLGDTVADEDLPVDDRLFQQEGDRITPLENPGPPQKGGGLIEEVLPDSETADEFYLPEDANYFVQNAVKENPETSKDLGLDGLFHKFSRKKNENDGKNH